LRGDVERVGVETGFTEFTTLKGAMAAAVSPEKVFVNPMLANKGNEGRVR
jgi:hypothetical protein